VTSFPARLREAQERAGSVLCVGLDPDPDRLPEAVLHEPSPGEAILAFNRALIDATTEYACAFKLNLAFYEALGREGWRVLKRTREHIPDGTLVIADAKRGDIGNSARFYAHALYDELHADACTVSPYMGADSVQPFLEHAGWAAFVLARTTNDGAADFQERRVDGGEPLYLHVARRASRWSAEASGDAGLVAGATDTEALRALREAAPKLPFLIPGIGAQGGEPRAVMQAASGGPVIVTSSRSIIYAGDGSDFPDAAARQARQFRDVLIA